MSKYGYKSSMNMNFYYSSYKLQNVSLKSEKIYYLSTANEMKFFLLEVQYIKIKNYNIKAKF